MKNDNSTEQKTKIKDELIINTESERLKTLNEQELIYNNKKDIKKNDIEININTDNDNKEEKKLKQNIDEIEEEEEEENLEEEVENIKIEKKSLNIEKTTVSDILNEINIDTKENLDLLKIDVNFMIKKPIKWTVYRTPSMAIKLFKKLYSETKKKEINKKTQEYLNIFELIKEYKAKDIFNNIEDIKEILNHVLEEPIFDNNLLINEFLNIGGSSFIQYNGGRKPFEGWGHKKADPGCMRKVFGIACSCLECWIFKQFNKRWIVLKDDMITYSDTSNSIGAKHVYFFDEGISCERVGKLNIKITNLSRVLELNFDYYYERELWVQEINKRIKIFKKLIKNNKYKAYTNEKKNNYAKWFIDGKDYFEDLFEKLMGAKKSIFITDWWMSPEVWLKRPIYESDYDGSSKKKIKEDNLSRLMDILQFKAKKGIKIYILIYYECTLALTLNSKYTQETLEQLHKNIMVSRHPSDKLDLLWSHHEKLVIIDQQIGYVGGLDLCWGRYDFKEHPIYEPENKEKKYYFPFIDYSNARICDFSNVDNYLVESVSREKYTRMPWHDVHTRLIGPVVGDISRHFVERWNYENFYKRNDSTLNNLKLQNRCPTRLEEGGFMDVLVKEIKKVGEKKYDLDEDDDKIRNSKLQKSKLTNTGTESVDLDENLDILIKNTPIFSYQNNSLNQITNSIKKKETNEQKEKNKFEEKKKKKIIFSWKGIYKLKKKETKDKMNKSDDDEEFNKRKNQWMKDLKVIDEDHLLIRKGIQSQLISDENPPLRQKNSGFYNYIVEKINRNKNRFTNFFKANHEIEPMISEKYIEKGSIPATVQVLRSAGQWSLGLKEKENSILEAYYRLIENSKNYIYIENQFFISRSFEDNGKSYLVENKIALYIRNRILKAIKNKEKFRVYIFIPLLPGFAGEPGESGTLQIILKYTYQGISRNHGLSIIEKLREAIGDQWQNFIGFYSLRNHGSVNGIPKTEIIYIHSKLMIVDDIYVLCGSANINDRSMNGSRDSEFAVLIKEKPVEKSMMNNKSYKGSKFAISLRKSLLAEHLGINSDDVRLNDPVSDELHKLIQDTAKNNTYTYHQIFGCYPDDGFTKFDMIKKNYDLNNETQKERFIRSYEENKNKIIGHIVEFPLKFLEDEQLGISFFSKENLIPEKNFT